MLALILKTITQLLRAGDISCLTSLNNFKLFTQIKTNLFWLTGLVALLLSVSFASIASAEEIVCARVKIEIKQELTMERQAFDAEMQLSNALDSDSLTEVSVVVNVTDELGVPVLVTSDPNNTDAKFFVRINGKQNISDVDGTGTVAQGATATINWLLIPAPGSAGITSTGKKYLVGATLKYKFGAETHTLEVSPDVISVKPLPLLTLDYFLTKDVWADDPLTPAIEAVEPFTLGVRVKNDGFATAKNLKIDSAQPKIIENNQGLLINFQLTGSYVDDAPVQNTLLINFNEIAAKKSKMGRWNMETTLAGTFTEFSARFSHADELGGAVTSILQATNAHLLLRDVRVDLPGRDAIRDFLALDGEVIRVYESEGLDTIVTDRSGVAQLSASTGTNGNANYHLEFPATAGFAYVKLPDPFNGTKALGTIVRSDAKVMLSENVWLSKTRNLETHLPDYWINFFDANTTGIYNAEFKAPPVASLPPVIQFIPNRVVKEEQQVSFLVEASSPANMPLTLSAAPLPAGATFSIQAPEAGVQRAIFSWTPPKDTVGEYLIVYSANDGTSTSTRSASIKVETNSPPPGPGTPSIYSPLSGAIVTTLKPLLGVLTSDNTQDPTTKVQFEIYSDEEMTQLVESSLVDKAAPGPSSGGSATVEPTTWEPSNNLNDNTKYWWRARGYDGTQMYSLWTNGQFKVNLFNEAPDSFNLTNPAPSSEVGTLVPTLAWTNATDPDEDEVTYAVKVYGDANMTDLVVEALDLPASPEGTTTWTVTTPLTNHANYYWRVIAKDALGAETHTAARPFRVNTGNTAPTTPVILSPEVGGQATSANVALIVQNALDAENDPISYVFEYDTVNTFDSGNKVASGDIAQNLAGSTSWAISGLVENTRYYWRVKAHDGHAESNWVMADFLMNAINEAPPTPTIQNPGNAAWSANLQPTFSVNAVLDPENDSVRYEFEIYKDAALTQKVTAGISDNTDWIVPVQLADKTTHWWRVRSVDELGAASTWTPASVLYVSSASYQDPTIQVLTPNVPTAPESVTTSEGTRKMVTINWLADDPNIEPTIALYYSNSDAGFSGNLIADGLHQSSGAVTGSYVWDVTSLPVGTYYIYGIVYDAKGLGKAYAAGAVVISPTTQTGKIVISSGNKLVTTEKGGEETFKVKLLNAPTANVVVPITSTNQREGVVAPNSLTFTPQNWSKQQVVTVTGQPDCANDSDTAYQVLSGEAISIDPQYMGLSGTPLNLTNKNDTKVVNGTTNNPNVHVCALQIVSETKTKKTKNTPNIWEYVLKTDLTNSGNTNLNGVIATLTQAPSGITIVDDRIQIGAMNAGDTVKAVDTITLRSSKKINASKFRKADFVWNIQVLP